MSKNKNNNSGIVYSTDPGFRFDAEDESPSETLIPAKQVLRVRLENKHRAGKAVTTVTGFQGREEDMEKLGKSLKSFCGTGGSVKDGEIIVQGDNREKILAWLLKNGYSGSKKV